MLISKLVSSSKVWYNVANHQFSKLEEIDEMYFSKLEEIVEMYFPSLPLTLESMQSVEKSQSGK